MSKLRAAVIGVGYQGRFHAQKFSALDDVDLVAVVDTDRDRAEQVAQECATRAATDFTEVLGGVDLVSIAVPTESHFAVAKTCIEAGTDILLEKPVTQTVGQAEALIRLAQERGRVFQVGHLERFNPALLEVRELLHNPLFIESHRLAAFKPRGSDVNVVLDLMIHDIDIILGMVNSEIAEVRSVGLPVLSGEVDIAHARLEFANGCVANVTASRVSQAPMRKLRVFQPNGYFSIDYQTHRLTVVRRVSTGQGVPELVMQEREFEYADPLLEEIRAFVKCVRSRVPPPVTGGDGRRALEVALRITESMRQAGERAGWLR
jgi:predicted dehydrogenase